MTGKCSCYRAKSAHHHGFGGTYPCEGPELCIRCQPIELHHYTVPKHLLKSVNEVRADEEQS